MDNKRSRFRLLPIYHLFFITLLFILFILITIFINREMKMELIIYDQDTGDEYARTEVKDGDQFTVQWVHSVEQETWQEILEINKQGEIVLIETRFRSFGSGVPSSKEDGNVYFEDGFLVMTDLYEVKQYYQWIHSHNAKFMILKNDEHFLHTTHIPHHHKAEMIIKEG